MPRVFVSHKKRDRQWATHLTHQLRGAGLEAFVDESLEQGDGWRARIDDEVAKADHLLLVASPEAVVSDEVRHEVNLFLQRKQSGRNEPRKMFVVHRALTPLPDAWNAGQHAAEECTPETYERHVRSIVGAVDRDAARQLPQGLKNPAWNEAARLGSVVRSRMLKLVAELFRNDEDDMRRDAVKGRFNLQDRWDEHATTPELLANAALVLWTGDDHDPHQKALDALSKLEKQLKKVDAAAFDRLVADLQGSKARAPDPSERLRDYYGFVLRETALVAHERLRWHGAEPLDPAAADHRELDAVYVALGIDNTTDPSGAEREVQAQAEAIDAAWLADPEWGIREPVEIWAAGGPGQLQEAVAAVAVRRNCMVDWVNMQNESGPRWMFGIRHEAKHIPSDLGTPANDHHGVFEVAGDRLVLAVRVWPMQDQLDAESIRSHLERQRAEYPRARILVMRDDPKYDIECLLRLNLALHPHLAGRYVLQGNPGGGKSTLLRRAARSFAKAKDGIPVLLSLPALAEHRRSLAEQVRQECSGICDVAAVVERLEGDGRDVVLLLDGLDEVTGEGDRTWVRKLLASLPNRLPRARVVVATRRIPYAPFDRQHFRDLLLQPLTEPQQLQLLTKWFETAPDAGVAQTPEQRANLCLRALQSAGSTRAFAELREVPLLLTFLAMAFESAGSFVGTRAQLYQHVISRMLEGKHRGGLVMEPIAGSRRALQHLAMEMTQDERSAHPLSSLETMLHWIWQREDLGDVRNVFQCRQQPEVRRFLLELCRRTGIVAGRDDADAPWRFPHRTLREALVAEHLLEFGRDEVLELARRVRGREGCWGEPFALFVGLLPAEEVDKWLLLLHEQNQALALRALASVERCASDTVQRLLVGAGADTAAILPRIDDLPAMLGPEAAVRTLGRLATEFGDTEVLWHIDQALSACEHAEPGLRTDVALVRAERLFSHPSFGARRGDPRVLAWVVVPAGEFRMGSPADDAESPGNEGPQRLVDIPRSLSLAKTCVTNEQFASFRLEFRFPAADRDDPVVEVSWFDAAMFCRWLGDDVRLPSEAEWEYACRAGTTTPFSFGANITPAQVNYHGDYPHADGTEGEYRGSTVPVRSLPANAWGLHEMHGNVLEWCEDSYGDYGKAPVDGRANQESGGSGQRVLRGGSWFNLAWFCRSASRFAYDPGIRYEFVGFRPASSSPGSSTTSPGQPSDQARSNQPEQGPLPPKRAARARKKKS